VFFVFLWQDGVMYDSDLIRTGDAAQILGSSRQHVVDLCNQGLLSCERSPKQRRLRRSEVEAFASRIGSAARLNRDQRQSVWLHGAVAGHLANDPQGTLARARTNLGRLRETHPSGMSSRWLDAWQSVLGGGPEAVLQTLTSQAPLAIELRQNSPFAGVLSDDERRAVLGAFRKQDHRAPA
jgi:excisionase family DNA binding protein